MHKALPHKPAEMKVNLITVTALGELSVGCTIMALKMILDTATG